MIKTPTIPEMIAELRAAGWSEYSKNWNAWQAPNSTAIYRGPYGAWKVMKDISEKDSEYLGSIARVKSNG